MNVSLTPELEKLVNDKVRSGLYQTASEVVREALRLLKQRDDDARLEEQRAGLAPESGRRSAEIPPRGGTRQRGRR
jgi:antitoxin ParD1/3/4